MDWAARETDAVYSRQSRNAIDELRVNKNTAVLKECNAFYENLCTEEPTDRESYDWLDSTLSTEDQALCEGALQV